MIALRFDFTTQIGAGHARRCLALAEWFPKKPILLVKGSEADCGPLLAGWPHLLIPNSLNLEEEIHFLSKNLDLENLAVTFFDISHQISYRNIPALPHFMSRFGNANSKRVLIDGLLSDSLLSRGLSEGFEYAITPYWGATAHAGEFEHLYGAEFFIVPKAIASSNLAPPTLPEIADKLILTMGASDPDNLSAQVLSAIFGAGQMPEVQVKVVVGSLFSEASQSALTTWEKKMPGQVQLLRNETDLLPHFRLADLALVGPGLTKYELAIVGTPGLFFSATPAMHEINELFSKAGSGVAIGPFNEISSQNIQETVNSILKDQDRRIKMSQNGRTLIDGRGATRILNRILKV